MSSTAAQPLRGVYRWEERETQLGMSGLGKMGASMVSRLLQGGHECVVFEMKPDRVKDMANKGATGAASLDDFMAKLKPPRAVWLMVPAAAVEVEVKTRGPASVRCRFCCPLGKKRRKC